MAAASPDLIDCERAGVEAASFDREFPLQDMPRLRGLLAERHGSVRAHYVFEQLASGRCGAEVRIEAAPELMCQRCMQGCAFPVSGSSELEFTEGDQGSEVNSDREFFRSANGRVSLREVAEEELLLALPHAFMCGSPSTCGKLGNVVDDDGIADVGAEVRRPFGVLHDLLKKT